MKSLFQTIVDIDMSDDFAVLFAANNLFNGWLIIEKLECSSEVKKKLVKLAAYKYSYESPLLKKKKDAYELKCFICEYLDLPIDDFVMDCLRNKNSDYEKFISWWLKQNADLDFAYLESLKDSFFEQLQLMRSGIDAKIECSSTKETAAAMKYFRKNEIQIKGEAAKLSGQLKSQIETLTSKLERKYEFFYNEVRKEGIDIPESVGWVERRLLKRKQNEVHN